MNEIEPQQGLDCVRIKFQMRLYLEQELAVDQTPPPHQDTIQRGIPLWGDPGVFWAYFFSNVLRQHPIFFSAFWGTACILKT